MFVAVGNSGDRVITSADGITWTARSAAGDNDAWRAVTYGNGLFVAVGDTGGTDKIMTSPDGVTWTTRTPPSGDWKGVTYGNGLFVAVGSSGGINYSMTSSDGGITWTGNGGAGGGVAITYGNGLFVAVNTFANTRTSKDGVTWTTRNSLAGYNPGGVVYGNGAFVVVSSGGVGSRVLVSGRADAVPFSSINVAQGAQSFMGNLGVGTTTGTASFSIFKPYGNTNSALFNIASSTNATGTVTTSFLSVSSTGFGTTTLSGLNISGSATST